ncbi:hypothetical protein [Sulfurivermis fontis]|uniref:hypothetical protein n=1 Tax=Sulfurivermis fontis TaxID=1972068 RepID=UPI000FDA521E|nr:hypothetical protein [Sulfurivermis fontis]
MTMKYVIQYELPYVHRVQVGIEAGSAEDAIAKAQRLFDDGSIWDDSPDVPLLFDDYEEEGDAGVPPGFSVEQTLSDAESWPEAEASVKAIRRRDAASRAAALLVEAYRRGEEHGGSVAWEDIDQALEAALEALPER